MWPGRESGVEGASSGARKMQGKVGSLQWGLAGLLYKGLAGEGPDGPNRGLGSVGLQWGKGVGEGPVGEGHSYGRRGEMSALWG